MRAPALHRPELLKLCTPVAYDVGNGVQPWQGQELWSKGRPTRPAFFNFVRNNRAVQSNIVHFQVSLICYVELPWSPKQRKLLHSRLSLRGSCGSRKIEV